MGRRTTRRPRRKKTSRPSVFFIIALAIGLILFFIMAVMVLRNPQKMKQGRAVPTVAAATALAA
jgi:hypothetical protein